MEKDRWLETFVVELTTLKADIDQRRAAEVGEEIWPLDSHVDPMTVAQAAHRAWLPQ